MIMNVLLDTASQVGKKQSPLFQDIQERDTKSSVTEYCTQISQNIVTTVCFGKVDGLSPRCFDMSELVLKEPYKFCV